MKDLQRIFLGLVVCVSLAHMGFAADEKVTGTVATISSSSITISVQRDEGTVKETVSIDKNTVVLKGDKEVGIWEIKEGDLVTISLRAEGKNKIAVKILFKGV